MLTDPGPSVPHLRIPELEQYGVVAGITTRGPDPEHPFDLGLWGESPVGTVLGHWRTLRDAFVRFPAVRSAHQCHGSEVHSVTGRPNRREWTITDGVDGLLTDQVGVLLTVTVADCIPIYLIDPTRAICALLHAGWRGTSAGILGRGVSLMGQVGCRVSDIIMYLGAGICGSCYEVGSDVMKALGLQTIGGGPWEVDLRAELSTQARATGLENIFTSQKCSFEDDEVFFSHRRGGVSEGRMIAFMGFPLSRPLPNR